MIDRQMQIFDQETSALKTIRGCARKLESLANAFGATGNDRVADELSAVAEMIYEAQQSILDGRGESLRLEVDEGQRNIAETFKALLTASRA